MAEAAKNIDQIRREQLAAGAVGGQRASAAVKAARTHVAGLETQALDSIAARVGGISDAERGELGAIVHPGAASRLPAIDTLGAMTTDQFALGRQALSNYMKAASASEAAALADARAAASRGGGGGGGRSKSLFDEWTDKQTETFFLDQAKQSRIEALQNLGTYRDAVGPGLKKEYAAKLEPLQVEADRAESTWRQQKTQVESTRRYEAQVLSRRDTLRKMRDDLAARLGPNATKAAVQAQGGDYGSMSTAGQRALVAANDRHYRQVVNELAAAERAAHAASKRLTTQLKNFNASRKQRDARLDAIRNLERERLKERRKTVRGLNRQASELASKGISNDAYEAAVRAGADPFLVAPLFDISDDRKFRDEIGDAAKAAGLKPGPGPTRAQMTALEVVKGLFPKADEKLSKQLLQQAYTIESVNQDEKPIQPGETPYSQYVWKDAEATASDALAGAGEITDPDELSKRVEAYIESMKLQNPELAKVAKSYPRAWAVGVRLALVKHLAEVAPGPDPDAPWQSYVDPYDIPALLTRGFLDHAVR